MSAHPPYHPHPRELQRRVLVAVMNNPRDLRRAASEGWYRIPQRRAPRRLGADYLAFYQTGAFRGHPEAHTVTFYAPVRGYRLLTRRELLPQEPLHPRADEFYFRIDIGPLIRLNRPVPAARLRRVTFIPTTLGHLLRAQDVTELFLDLDPLQTLWQALQAHRLRPLAHRLVGEWPVDIALRAQGGYLGIRLSPEETGTRERMVRYRGEPWLVLEVSQARLQEDLEGCLREIGVALLELGGAMDTRPGPPPRFIT